MPREKTPEEAASLARQRTDNVALRRAMEAGRGEPEKEDWRKALDFSSLVNYASAPVGGQVYDSTWVASNSGAR